MNEDVVFGCFMVAVSVSAVLMAVVAFVWTVIAYGLVTC